MKKLKFKSNIKCMGCVGKVKPFLDAKEGINKWEVDIYTPEKTLTVEAENLTAEEIKNEVEKAGFKAELIDSQSVG
jgi:copper chaperone